MFRARKTAGGIFTAFCAGSRKGRWKGLAVRSVALFLVLAVVGCAAMRTRRLERKEEIVSVLTYNLETMIDRPADDVFDLIKKWNTYVVGYAEYTATSGRGLTGVGNFSSGRANIAGRKVVWHEVVAEWEEGRAVKLVYSGDMRGSIRMSVEPVGDKTLYNFTGHLFFLPDSMLTRTLNVFLEQGLLGDQLDRTVTDWIVKDIATLEEKTPDEVKLTGEPRHAVFADAYLKAQEAFTMPAGEVFELFNSTGGLKSILPVESIEPMGGASEKFEGLGGHYKVTVTEGFPEPLVYDMVVVQNDAPREARFYLYAHGVSVEMDIVVVPTLSGCKALVIFILDMPESMEGRALDVFMHTSNIDQAVQEALIKLKNRDD